MDMDMCGGAVHVSAVVEDPIVLIPLRSSWRKRIISLYLIYFSFKIFHEYLLSTYRVLGTFGKQWFARQVGSLRSRA